MAHENFLDDPCEISIAPELGLISQLQSLHTKIVMSTAGGVAPIKVGDVIIAECHAGDNNMLYNLQQMTFVNVYESYEGQNVYALTERCKTLRDTFGEGIDGTVGGGEVILSEEEGDYANIVFLSSRQEAGRTPAVDKFLSKWRVLIPSSEAKEVIITGTKRTPASQARAMYKDREKSGCTGAYKLPFPSKCMIHYELYGKGSLIREVLAVKNTKALMTTVLENQVSRGEYISRHMRGLGIDVRTSNLTAAQQQFIRSKAASLGANVVDEGDHIHIGVPASFETSTTSLASNPKDYAGSEPDSA